MRLNNLLNNEIMKTPQSEFKVGMVVKYKRPERGEEDLRFYVTEIHKPTNKLHVELVCDYPLKPTACEFSDEFEPSWFTKKVEYEGEIVKAICFGRF